ncbi:MAG TPA: SMC family ATPase [Dehalococcoidia bacterium]|nr:SMC family ATPase [Dehalococcoidia bacterium]
MLKYSLKMIPVKLKMRNFMPYRGDIPPFSFEGIHTACICGDNGNGKSALIDAITWALWGKTRTEGTKISDDALIHAEENDMEVEFDFTIGDQDYRIIRKHARPRRRTASGQSSLDLFIAANGVYKSLTGNTKSDTQQKLISLLNMDYDTFINSAFLKQGHADKFTKQPPSKRKEVLANILRLSLYDQLEEKARELGRQLQVERTQLETSICDINQELDKKPEVEAGLEQAQQELANLEGFLKKCTEALNRLRQEKQSLEHKKLQLAQLEEHIEKSRSDLNRWHSQMAQRLKRLDEYRQLISRREDTEDGYRRFGQAQNLNNELNEKLQRLNRIKDKKSQLEQAIHKAQSALLADHAVARNRIAELEAVSQGLPQLKSNLAKLNEEKSRLSDMENSLEAKRNEQQQLHSLVHELERSREQRQREIKEVAEKINLLNAQTDAACPLCETRLTHQGLEIITDKYSDDMDAKIKEQDESEADLTSKKAEMELITKGISQMEADLNRDRLSLQGKTSVIVRSISEAEEADVKLNTERELLADIEYRLASKSFAPHEQEALAGLESEIDSLGYDANQHDQAIKQVAEFRQYELQQQKLDEALRLLAVEQQEVSRAEEAVRELEKRIEFDSEKKQALASELEFLPGIEGELQQAEAEHQTFTDSQRQAQEKTGNLKGRLDYLLKQETVRKEKENHLKRLGDEDSIYTTLATAFGKKGIQAMLIEMALPEIETEANRLLGRMTDNRMHVKIEAQRQSKKGEPIETLDIIISDELGPRPYETYSGGEAFRIDFAIRIALSRLLAKRAGAPLPTLIIDEGFGTQDSTGIEKLKEAINSIKDSFDKIIVITHMEELKDAFPTRINVVKTAHGSTLELD